MESHHDALRHLKYLRQSLAQDNESIGFFLSAGCPLAVEMPEGSWPLIPDVAGLSLYVNTTLENDIGFKALLAEMEKAGRDKNNIEDTLSFVRSLLVVATGGDVRGLSEAALKSLEKSICGAIVSKLNVALPSTNTPYHRMCKWIKSIDRKVAIEIFTTNYDLLADQALEDTGVPYFDGFVGSRKSFFDLRAVEDNEVPRHWSRVWKIHGSINWVQEIVSEKARVHRLSEIKSGVSHLIYPSHLKYEESRKMPYLALMDQLNRFIRRKSSFLLISGYSFNDDHVNDTIINALVANPTAMVLGLMFERYYKQDSNQQGVERYPKAYRLAENQHNLNIWTFDKAIIGTNPGSWTLRPTEDESDVDLMRFINQEQTQPDQPPSYQIRLGDFSIFADFLQKIIGTSKDPQNA
jgi:hypothetical protein